MSLERFAATNFRCFQSAELECGREFNLIVGKNASGKTSLLEAIFFLGRGRSVRAPRQGDLLLEGAEEYRVVGRESGRTLGVGWSAQGFQARISGSDVGLAELAEAAGYHDDCQYLEDVVNGVIEGRYKPIEENETDGT